MADCTHEAPSEVTDINKQRFLAELSQLLTFMYEEDRQDALLAYSNMFDEAADEQALLQSLVSPIRQAVLVARAYNATERKLQTRSQSRAEAGAERNDSVAPDFLQAIFAIRAEAMQKQTATAAAAQADANQFSLFDQAAQEQAAAAEAPVIDAAPAPAEETASEEAPAAEAEDSAEAEAAPAPLPDDPEARVDAFMADYASPADEPAADAAESPAAEEETHDAEDEDEQFVVVMEGDGKSFVERTVLKPRVPLLILYVLLAIPVTVAGIALLLIPTVLCLGAAALCISVGVMAVSSVFGGFAVLADLLVVLGAALILLALGLLFLWLAIWFIGGGIVGLVRGVRALARKWCYKEVPAI